MDMGALGRFEASLEVRKYPGCPACVTPNHDDKQRVCLKCGTPLPGGEVRLVGHVVTVGTDRLFPWHARALLAVGMFLKRLAQRLKGD